ncbi:MAG: hypothetical protein AB1779_05085 [Candidatus Thermoplasmatota archaeon]
MNFPKNNYELKEIFKNAKTPKISEFDGEYFVDMLTVLPSLRKISHRKIFYSKNNKVFGYNVLFTDKIWGAFFLEEGICKEIDSLKVVVINYDRTENSFITKRIRDHVRCIEEKSLYIGRFNYLFGSNLRFLGYFSLSKAKE